MKCVICHGDDISVRDVMEELVSEKDVIRIPLRVPVCSQCGERYYDRKTMKHIADIKEKISNNKKDLREIGHVLIYGK
jgi:YgiT-type zinc finger domain-containing protein